MLSLWTDVFFSSSTSFTRLFSVNQVPALVFVMDTTGSMFEEITAARLRAHSIIQNRASSPGQPGTFILVPFHDPGKSARTVSVRNQNSTEKSRKHLLDLRVLSLNHFLENSHIDLCWVPRNHEMGQMGPGAWSNILPNSIFSVDWRREEFFSGLLLLCWMVSTYFLKTCPKRPVLLVDDIARLVHAPFSLVDLSLSPNTCLH